MAQKTGGGTLYTGTTYKDAPKREDYNTADEYYKVWQEYYNNPYQSQYTGQWNEKAQGTLGEIDNQKNWKYDASADTNWLQAKENYTKQGKLAMKDTMANAAAKTGGYGNSYATSAGQQSYNQYMQDLANLQPQYEENAYNRHKGDVDALYNELSSFLNLDNTEYERDQDAYNNYNTEKNTAWDNYQTALGNDQANYNTDYNAWQDERDFQSNQKQQLIQNALTAGDYDTLDYLGIDTTTLRENHQAELYSVYKNTNTSTSTTTTNNDGSKTYKDANGNSITYYQESGNGLMGVYTTSQNASNGNVTYTDAAGNEVTVKAGVNPYTNDTNKDALTNGEVDSSKVFSNGYQPNNVDGQKLSSSGQQFNGSSVTIGGVAYDIKPGQTIWKTEKTRYVYESPTSSNSTKQTTTKYYLWVGQLNKYVEVDI